ncbi:hypothetical protein NX059_012401 [Plenodomus lindquistii]|nr:hypothetical protein NX059_012401 [Plenodomus lindquistii]
MSNFSQCQALAVTTQAQCKHSATYRRPGHTKGSLVRCKTHRFQSLDWNELIVGSNGGKSRALSTKANQSGQAWKIRDGKADAGGEHEGDEEKDYSNGEENNDDDTRERSGDEGEEEDDDDEEEDEAISDGEDKPRVIMTRSRTSSLQSQHAPADLATKEVMEGFEKLLIKAGMSLPSGKGKGKAPAAPAKARAAGRSSLKKK